MKTHRLLFVALGLCLISALSWAGSVTGIVFLDDNANGAREEGEAGIAGVQVSDGFTLVRTNAEGAYSLTSPEGYLVVRVTNPTGYWFSGPFWKGFESTGEPVEADFALIKQDQSLPLTFADMTDIHVNDKGFPRFQEFITRLNAQEPAPAFVIATGDLVMDVLGAKTPEQVDHLYGQYETATADLKLRLFNLPGNHEHVGWNSDFDRAHPWFGKGAYQRKLGPLYYSFNYGPYRLLLLDATTQNPDGGYFEEITPDCMAWLEQELAATPKDSFLVVFVHEPLYGLRNRFDLGKLLTRDHKVVACFSGHTHNRDHYYFFGAKAEGAGAVSGSWWNGPSPDGTPEGCLLVTLKEQGIVDWTFLEGFPASD